MPFQIPKKDHPWRQYQKKEDTEEKKVRPIKTVVHEITESWDNIEVTTISGNRKYLYELPQSKQAIWLINFIKKSYVQY